MQRETRLVQSFKAKDQDGNFVALNVFQEFITVHTNGGPSTTEGLKTIKTANGGSVNRREKGVYVTVGFPALTLTSDEPDAP